MASLSLNGPLDLYRVRARCGLLRERTAHPRFAPWWEGFLAQCRQWAEKPAWPEVGPTAADRHARSRQVSERMEMLAFAAILTEDDSLGRHAASMLRAVAGAGDVWASPAHRHHYPQLHADLMVAEHCKRVAATLSWAADWLTPEDRQAALAALRVQGGGAIFADAEKGAWWADAPNSNWCAVLNSGLGLAAVAVAEEDPELAARWMDRARWAVGRVLDLATEEGAGIEGLGYWIYCFRSALDLAEVLADAGDDSLLSHPCWRRAVEFPLNFALPDLSGWANYGDCGSGLGGSPLFFALASHFGDRRAQWFGNRVAGEGGAARFTHRDLIACDPEFPEESPESLPTCRLFSSVHLAALRSDWGSDAVFFSLKGGSNAWSHCHLDLNSFILSAFGERLAVDPGPWPYTEDYWTSVEPPVSTAWHNTLTVDGGDQRQPPRYRMSYDLEEGGDAYGRLDNFHDAGWAAVLRGDATSAYADTLERFHRHVLYLKPDTFLLFDDVRLREVRTQRHLQWLLHTIHPLERLSDGSLVARGERAALHVRPLLPHDHASRFLSGRSLIGKNGERQPLSCWALRPPWHHLWNVAPERSPYPQWDPRGEPLFGTRFSFLVLLQATRAGNAARWNAEAWGDESAPGARLTAGDEEVRVAWNPEGRPFTNGDIATDARQVVLRFRSGRLTDWLALDAGYLTHEGTRLLAATERLPWRTG